ncbi:MAG TPA: sulfite exporter TauE/SafE family protein [Thermoanaerobaculia bacterium]|nr:sulfite exporter TauE/SafE family protein [Thermoanaerobaculia bacterium]
MTTTIIALVALAASALTFFSGFGLGTLLLPAFAFFYPIDVAVASTALVHFLNGLFKLALVGRHADRRAVIRFGLPAIVSAFVGAWLLVRLADVRPLASYTLFGTVAELHPVKLAVGMVLLATVAFETVPRLAAATMPPRLLPLGGVISGFLGGLSGMQGALRSAFLVRLGLTKEAFIGTGVVVAVLVDVSRLGVYARGVHAQRSAFDVGTLGVAVVAAFAGAVLGNRFLTQLTMRAMQRIVGTALALVALALIAGLL